MLPAGYQQVQPSATILQEHLVCSERQNRAHSQYLRIARFRALPQWTVMPQIFPLVLKLMEALVQHEAKHTALAKLYVLHAGR